MVENRHPWLLFVLAGLVMSALPAFAIPQQVIEEPSVEDADPSEEASSDVSIDEADPSVEDDPMLAGFGDPGEELLLWQDFDVVVTASRQEQRINQSAIPVSVITADDIHFGGYTSIADVLQLVPGIDLGYVDRNNPAYGVRGLHYTFSDRTLVLLNGRNASSPIFGGTDISQFPLIMEDIERIEVVRGPGGAAWGANAFNGVINVITKKPDDPSIHGVLSSFQINEYGDAYGQFRIANGGEDWAFRLSGSMEDRETSENAIHGDDFESRDFSRDVKIDTELMHRLGDRTTLRFGAAYAHIDRGDFEFIHYFRQDERIDNYRLFARVEQDISDELDGYVQWTGNINDAFRPNLWRATTWDHTLDGQLTYSGIDRHVLTVGGNIRLVDIDFSDSYASPTLGGGDENEQWAGLFLIDRWSLHDRFEVDLQGRVDWYSETKIDWSGRASLLYSIDRDGEHTGRLSVAKAYRAPQLVLRRLEALGTPLPIPGPPLYGVELRRNAGLDHEQAWIVEAGYAGRLADGVTLRTDTYYQRYEDLIGPIQEPDPLSLGRYIATLDNQGGADGYGAEVELVLADERRRLSLWYAYNAMDLDSDHRQIRALRPAEHKVGATGRLAIDGGWTMQGSYIYHDSAQSDGIGGRGTGSNPRHRLDLALSKSLFDERAELTVGVFDLLDSTDAPLAETGTFSHETPGRTIFARVQVKF